MAVTKVGCVLVYTLIMLVLRASSSDLSLEVYKPRGLKVSLSYIQEEHYDDYDITFHANVNEPTDIVFTNGSIRGNFVKVRSGQLEFEDREAQLKIGDVINYYVIIKVNKTAYAATLYRSPVTELKERIGDELPIATTSRPDPHVTTGDVIYPPKKCEPTLTTVRGGKACGGQIIFEDYFHTLREDVWQIEQYVPVTSHPEHPFVTYINNYDDPLVFVANGSLHITPKILQHISGFDNESIYLGELSLDDESGCTSHGDECYRRASGPEILPPVMSGRVTSTHFAFRYGTVYVKAKLPQGDWLYPELLLEPFQKKYGLYDYVSGVLKIAAARGNKELKKGADRYDNGVLYGGPIMDVQCRQRLLATRAMDGLWGDDFHEYSLTWTPNFISLSVDGEEWANIKPTSSSFLARFPRSCTHLQRERLQNGTKMAPFDEDFILTLGVAAGGITEFPDESHSAGARPKPWRGAAHKSMLTFWQDLPSWEKTWNQPRLIIDYVKVVAL